MEEFVRISFKTMTMCACLRVFSNYTSSKWL